MNILKSLLIMGMLVVSLSHPVLAAWQWPWEKEEPKSVEEAMLEAANVQTWKQHLRQREAVLNHRDASIQQQIRQQQQANTHLQQDVVRRESALQQQFQHLQQESATREAVLQQQLDQQQEAIASNRLQQGMQPANALYEVMQRQQQQPSPQSTPDLNDHSIFLQGVAPKKPQAHKTNILVFQAPTPLPPPTLPEPLDTRIQTTINGIDQIETTAILPDTLQVPQLEAVKKIADNGVIVAQQRFVVEQQKIGSAARLSRLRITKSFVLWGLLLFIPLLLTLSWMVRKAVGGWQQWQREKLAYKVKELEAIEGQMAVRKPAATR